MNKLSNRKTFFPLLFNNGYTLQFYSNGCRQGIYTYRGATRLVILKILGIYLIVCLEIAFHIYQKHSDVYQFVPAAATFFQYGAHILKNAMALCRKVEFNMVAMLIGSEARYFVAASFARPNA